MIRGKHDIQCTPCSSRSISEMLPENHTVQKGDFLKPIRLDRVAQSVARLTHESEIPGFDIRSG